MSFELPEGLPEGPWNWCIHDHSLATLHDKRGSDWGHLLSIGPCDACAKSAAGEWKWGRCRTPPEAIARAIASIPDMVAEIERLRKERSWAENGAIKIAGGLADAADEADRLRALNAELQDFAVAALDHIENPLIATHLRAILTKATGDETK